MMTKDKKPFTYTPGMGGKLDLSQIRSPRMARRVAKNANDEGIEGPPKTSPLAYQEPRSPPTPGMYAHPQVAVPVFPQGMPQQQQQQQPGLGLKSSAHHHHQQQQQRSPPVIERVDAPAAPRPTVKVETKMQPVANLPDTPTPPISPTQVTLSKAPTPWMLKQAKQQEELPEWAKRSNNRSQDSSSSGSESPQYQAQSPPALPRQIVVVNPPVRQPQQQQQQPQMRPVTVRQDSERVVPVRIEDRPSVFSALNESGHHQLSNTAPHHMSRWGNPVGQSGTTPQSPGGGGAYIVPVQVEEPQQYQMPNSNHNQGNRNAPRVIVVTNQPGLEPGPVQSKSFRVLQKITDTDADQLDGEQIRKLQLTEDDRHLMNKFKEQVDGDTYLHKEEDPRYRGAAIPSRAFRYLQTMTDAGDAASANSTAKPASPAVKKQNRNSTTFEEAPVYVPASEQQVPEPKKYMGGAIPSRSFRLLQAMTAPESIATQVMQENRQDSATDFVSGPVNQQGTYYPTYPNPIPPTSQHVFWNPEIGWWFYYPIQSYAPYAPTYPPYEHYPHPYYHYHPEYYSGDFNADFDNENKMCTQCPLHDNSHASELNDSNSDECAIAFRGNSLSRNSNLYIGSQWPYDSSTTPTSCTTTTTEKSDKIDEKQKFFSPSPLSSLPPEEEFESEGDAEEEEEDSRLSSKRKDDEENKSAESSDSSSDSGSYIAYSTNLGTQKDLPKQVETKFGNNGKNDKNSTDYLNEVFNEAQCVKEENGSEESKRRETIDEEDLSNTTVSVRLPLRFKFSVSDDNEDVTTLTVGDSTVTRDVNMCVDFTLKKPNTRKNSKKEDDEETNQPNGDEVQDKDREQISQRTVKVKPTFIVTTTDEDNAEGKNHQEDTSVIEPSIEEKRELLSVQSHSREEATDDEDSGVTSDTSRIISEVDTDSESCPTTKPTTAAMSDKSTSPVCKRTISKYQRVQTHSRLFRLLNDEQLKLPGVSNCSSQEERSSNSSGLTSPDSTLADQPIFGSTAHRQLPMRPKSLDCGSFFNDSRRNNRPDTYYQTWKNCGEPAKRKSAAFLGDAHQQWATTHHPPRVNVLCPRVKGGPCSAPRSPTPWTNNQQPSRMKSPLGSIALSSSSIPSPARTTRNRC